MKLLGRSFADLGYVNPDIWSPCSDPPVSDKVATGMGMASVPRVLQSSLPREWSEMLLLTCDEQGFNIGRLLVSNAQEDTPDRRIEQWRREAELKYKRRVNLEVPEQPRQERDRPLSAYVKKHFKFRRKPDTRVFSMASKMSYRAKIEHPAYRAPRHRKKED